MTEILLPFSLAQYCDVLIAFYRAEFPPIMVDRVAERLHHLAEIENLLSESTSQKFFTCVSVWKAHDMESEFFHD
jgi:hypothetical protein